MITFKSQRTEISPGNRLFLSALFLACSSSCLALTSEDAYITSKETTWTLGTESVERVIVLEQGRLITRNFKDKRSGREIAAVDATGPWTFKDAKTSKLSQGELELDLTLQRDSLAVTKSYVVYPGSSIIREWTTIKNAGRSPVTITDPEFFSRNVRLGELQSLRFHWMTGALNTPGSWQLQTEQLPAGTPRTFNSLDPFQGTIDYISDTGSGTYAPWTALYDSTTHEGVFIGWDYFGRWASHYTANARGAVAAQFQLADFHRSLAPGEQIETPKAFMGLFRDDLDNAGNELLDWQYRYLWDYTRDEWFPAIRMLGNWWKDTSLNAWITGKGPTGFHDPDFASVLRLIFRTADLMRYVGADVYHREPGWWDRTGDWGGPDFKSSGEYLRRSDMGQLIYAPLYKADLKSKVAQQHPDWVITSGKDMMNTQEGTLNMALAPVTDLMNRQLDDFVARWGDLEWRNDDMPTSVGKSDPSVLLGQDQGFRGVLQRFLDKHPRSAFQAVNAGGMYAGYDYVRYASSLSFSDGAVGIVRNYWTSLLFPPDKSSDIPNLWMPDLYEKSLWRGLLCINFDMTGDTWNREKLEGIRELIDIYHYLKQQGVVGRWVKVYRPVVDWDLPFMFFERLSRDRKRGIIISKGVSLMGSEIVRPKGLLPTERYFVNFQDAKGSEERTGADLMKNGIALENMSPGELIYLNMPMHPGSPLDKEPPRPPSAVVKRGADNMGFPGVELEWQPGSDNNWVSYYQVIRNGVTLDKVAKGTFYFDHSAGADVAARYEIRTVDGAGNVSTGAFTASGPARPARIVDDSAEKELKFSGQWVHEKAEPLVAHLGTITSTHQKGAAVELTFEGKRVLWFTRMGEENGKAAVSIDGGTPQIVDTYSADNVWGAGVYRKEFPSVARHTLRIEALGQHNERAKDEFIYIDGLRVEAE